MCAGGGGGMAVVVSSCASAWEVDRAVRGERKLQSKVYLERMVAVVNATSMLCPGNMAHEAQVAVQCSPRLVSSIVLVNIEALGDRVDEVHSLYLFYCYKSTNTEAARRMTDATTATVH
jgi:hypothetical protein